MGGRGRRERGKREERERGPRAEALAVLKEGFAADNAPPSLPQRLSLSLLHVTPRVTTAFARAQNTHKQARAPQRQQQVLSRPLRVTFRLRCLPSRPRNGETGRGVRARGPVRSPRTGQGRAASTPKMGSLGKNRTMSLRMPVSDSERPELPTWQGRAVGVSEIRN